MDSRRTSVGVLLSSTDDSVQSTIWQTISRSAKKKGVEFFTYVTSSLDHRGEAIHHQSELRDILLEAPLDALIVFSGSIANNTDTQEAEQFILSLGNLPCVSIALKIKNTPSILVDNHAGVFQVVHHLVSDHNCKNFAFVKGPEGHQEADDRYHAFCSALEEHGLSPHLVCPGDFSKRSGMNAAKMILDSNKGFDAIMASDDSCALGLLEELQRKGYSVPGDVAVVGYDNATESANSLPSLTTLAQPMNQQGEKALEILLDRIQGKKTDDLFLHTKLVRRRSCGCFPDNLVRDEKKDFPDHLPRKGLAKIIHAALVLRFELKVGRILSRQHHFDLADSLDSLVEAFLSPAERLHSRDAFLNRLDEFFFQISLDQRKNEIMLALLDHLQCSTRNMGEDNTDLPLLGERLRKGHALLASLSLTMQKKIFSDRQDLQNRVVETSRKLISTFEKKHLVNIILEDFPDLGIDAFCLSLYDEQQNSTSKKAGIPKNARLITAYCGNRKYSSVDVKDAVFPTAQLYPDFFAKYVDQMNKLIMPLFFEKEQLGLVVFFYRHHFLASFNEELRLHLNSAIKSSQLLAGFRKQSIMDELTKLYNRRGFLKMGKVLVENITRTKRHAMLLFLDLDGLKSINDTFGHEDGDRAIQGAAEVLREVFRKEDILGRLGGDEFTVLITPQEKENAEAAVSKRLETSILRWNESSSFPWKLSMSLGCSNFGNRGSEAFEEVMREADERLLKHKRNRKGARRGK